ncbi:MAG TPA: helix-turn-helix domain-containing protein [Ilumatobacteraceae bacterium]|nr:helix-turn-helix domain-containing protein [Ilumatobacteraceae bacterium]
MERPINERAAIHAALGDPTRLAIVDELAVSDRSPSELAERFGLLGNLLAHHLVALERVGVIERIRSAGDQRRRYVRLCAAALQDLAPPTLRVPERVVFVCTHNSARSQLAAALWQEHTGLDARSAGTQPAEHVHPGAIAAAHRHGLDLTGAVPRAFDESHSNGVVITVCDLAHEQLHPSSDTWHWSIPDPVAIGTDTAFDDALNQLDTRIRALN